MPGFWELNPDNVDSVREIAYFDADAKRWRAGPDAPDKYTPGQFVETREVKRGDTTRQLPGGDVGRAYTVRRKRNQVKGLMRRSEQEAARERSEHMDDELTEGEAWELADEFVRALDAAESDQEVRDIRREYLGYE